MNRARIRSASTNHQNSHEPLTKETFKLQNIGKWEEFGEKVPGEDISKIEASLGRVQLSQDISEALVMHFNRAFTRRREPITILDLASAAGMRMEAILSGLSVPVRSYQGYDAAVNMVSAFKRNAEKIITPNTIINCEQCDILNGLPDAQISDGEILSLWLSYLEKSDYYRALEVANDHLRTNGVMVIVDFLKGIPAQKIDEAYLQSEPPEAREWTQKAARPILGWFMKAQKAGITKLITRDNLIKDLEKLGLFVEAFEVIYSWTAFGIFVARKIE